MVKLKPGPRVVNLAAAVAGFVLVEVGIGRLSLETALIVGGVLLLAGSLWRPKVDG